MNQVKQSGNIFIVLIFCFITLAAGIAWWLAWNATQSSSQSTTSQTVQPNPNAGYVVIKEWGTRFKPADGLAGVVYYRVPQGNDDFLAFTTEDLAKADEHCGPTSGNIALAGVTRSKEPDSPGSGQRYGPINGYYYYVRSSGAACSTTPNNLESGSRSLLLQSLGSLEAAQ